MNEQKNLWRIQYIMGKREIQKIPIIRTNKSSYTITEDGPLFQGSKVWNAEYVKFDEIGIEFFLTKEDALKNKIKEHNDEVMRLSGDIESMQDEIKHLERLLKNALKSNSELSVGSKPTDNDKENSGQA